MPRPTIRTWTGELFRRQMNAVLDYLSNALDGFTASLSGKQDTLVSGTNIKTINGNSLLGSGNIPIAGGGGLADGDYGDITVSGGATVFTIDAAAVTLSKMADLATSTILGRATAGTGAPEALTAGQVRSIINVADGATANSADAVLLARANHTGTQDAATITGSKTSAFISDFTAAVRAVPGYAVTATAGATTTLTAASADMQIFTGVLGQTIVLPDVSTLELGRTFRIRHAGSTVQLTVQSSGGNIIGTTIAGDHDAIYTCIANSGTDASVWLSRFDGAQTRSGSGPMLFGFSPTFTGTPIFPASVAGGASLRIPHGVAPTAPVDGDIWTDTSGVKARINGVTQSLGGSTVNAGIATITPNRFAMEWREDVTVAGMTPGRPIIVSLGPFDDTDENDAELLDMDAISGVAGTGLISFVAAFRTRTTGPVKLSWSAF